MSSRTKRDQDSVLLGEVEIVLPTVDDPSCSIMHDLAGLFGLDHNGDAGEKLRRAWTATACQGRLDVDHESDYVFIHAGREAIVRAAVLIHELAEPPRKLNATEIERVRKVVRRHRRPKPHAWRVGDVFRVPLLDGRSGFGQVLYEHDFHQRSGIRAPTCTLLEHATARPWQRGERLGERDLEEVLTARTLAILHVSSQHLDAQRWQVVGWHAPMDDPFSGPCGIPGQSGCVSWDGLETLANAYWGLAPWNLFYRDDYLDRFLMPGVLRPAGAVLLDLAELEARGVVR